MSDPLTRRTALAITGVGLSAPALAACGSSGNGASSAPPTGADTTPADPASSGGAGGGQDVGPAAAVAVGGGKIFAQQNVVVTQPTAGTFKAFGATCTHQGCQVAKVADGKIQCPCHGSEYSITDGSVVGGPAPAPLPTKQVAAQGGNLVVS